MFDSNIYWNNTEQVIIIKVESNINKDMYIIEPGQGIDVNLSLNLTKDYPFHIIERKLKNE